MGVAPVGSQKYFTFDGETSKKYNTHITGQGVFNAPVRAVEMVNIPNRNGAFALDQGYFENVELTYKASIAADTATEFAQAVSDLRNWLCSKKGYCRLEDEYNPNEYRMAVYKSGLEVEPFLITSGTFDIVFDCKPQRFLTSGETAVSVANNGTITNPTLFEAKPQLQVWGYGTFNINGYEIELENETLGNVKIANGKPKYAPLNVTSMEIPLDASLMNSGDTFSIEDLVFRTGISIYEPWLFNGPSPSISDSNANVSTVYANETKLPYPTPGGMWSSVKILNSSYTRTVYTWGNNDTETNTITITGMPLVNKDDTNQTSTVNITIVQTVAYVASDNSITLSISVTVSPNTYYRRESMNYAVSDIYGNSSVSQLGNPTYIDCDIGECYMIKNDEVVSLNNKVIVGMELPTLKAGNNIVTFDNTVTQFKVQPRWWKV